MKITNKHQLPEPIVKAASQNYRPIKGRLSVTQLINPPQMEELRRRHWDELEQDASDMLWMIMGTAMHLVFQQNSSGITEKKVEYQYDDDVKIVGKIDLLEGDTVVDYKYTSVYSVLHPKSEWEEQLNCYAWLLRKEQIYPKKLANVVFLRDWSAAKAGYDAKYPDCQMVTIPMGMWDDAECEQYIVNRVRMFKEAWHRTDDELQECTDAERWAMPKLYYVSNANKKPYNFKTLNAAELWQNEHGGTITAKSGDSIRCEKYCIVAKHCSQYKSTLETNGIKNDLLNIINHENNERLA